MHILMLPSWYPTAEDPIRGVFFAEQARALAKNGHRVSVFPLYADADRGAHVEQKSSGRMTEFAIHYKPLPFHLTFLRVLRQMLALIRSMPREERPEVIHVHSFRAIRYAKALKRLLGLPVMVTEHATWFERGLLSEKELSAVRRDYAACDRIIAVSEGMKETISPYANKEITVIPNMVNEAFFAGELHREREGTFRFICVASLDYKKGIDTLLYAFAALRKKGVDAHLTICGRGDDQEDFFALAEELHMGANVEFTGQVSRIECVERLRQSDAFVLPSRAETFGIVYAEAMACGLPIVMTKSSAYKALVTPETGLAVEIGDADALTEAMHSVTEHYEQYDPETIRAFCALRYSEKAVCERLTEEYEKLAARA